MLPTKCTWRYQNSRIAGGDNRQNNTNVNLFPCDLYAHHNMEVHDTKNILIKCYPATNHLLCKLINKSPSAHLINLGSVSWKIPFETFCKVKLLFSSLVKPTFQKSLQLPLTESFGDIWR